MKYIAAYALIVLSGKGEPTADQVTNVLKEAGIKADADHVTKIITALKGKQFHELVTAGKKKLASLGSVAPAAGAAGGKPAAAAKVVEEKPKEEEAADVDMGNMFGDDDYWVFLADSCIIP